MAGGTTTVNPLKKLSRGKNVEDEGDPRVRVTAVYPSQNGFLTDPRATNRVRDIRQRLTEAADNGAVDALERNLVCGNPQAEIRAAAVLLEFSTGKVAAVKLPEQRFLDIVFEGLAEGLKEAMQDPDQAQAMYDRIHALIAGKVDEIKAPQKQEQQD